MDKAYCSQCRFFDLQNSFQLGLCKRYPSFVNRSPKESCGEFMLSETKIVQSEVKVFTDLPDTIDNLVAQSEKKKPGRPKLRQSV